MKATAAILIAQAIVAVAMAGDIVEGRYNKAPVLPEDAKALVADFMQQPDCKVFIIAIDEDGGFAHGFAVGKETKKEAAKIAVQQCDAERKRKGIEALPYIYALNNKVVFEMMYMKAQARFPNHRPKKKARATGEDGLQEKYRAELELIVIPPDDLPENCRLAPMDKGPRFLPGNPAVSRDPRVILMVSMASGADPSITNDIECAFSAVYHDDGGKETGVNLLLFKKEEKAGAIFQALESKACFPLIHHGRYLMCIWTDNQNMELAGWMKAHFDKAAFPEQEPLP